MSQNIHHQPETYCINNETTYILVLVQTTSPNKSNILIQSKHVSKGIWFWIASLRLDLGELSPGTRNSCTLEVSTPCAAKLRSMTKEMARKALLACLKIGFFQLGRCSLPTWSNEQLLQTQTTSKETPYKSIIMNMH